MKPRYRKIHGARTGQNEHEPATREGLSTVEDEAASSTRSEVRRDLAQPAAYRPDGAQRVPIADLPIGLDSATSKLGRGVRTGSVLTRASS